MSVLILFLIWYNLFARQSPKMSRFFSDKLPKIVFGLILASVILSSLPGMLFGLFFACAPFLVLYWLIKSIFGTSKKMKQDTYSDRSSGRKETGITGSRTSYYDNKRDKKNKFSNLTGLTKMVSKRRKIIQKFNKKYNLCLTEEEVERIIDASYISFAWEREIYDMDVELNSLYEWYNCETAWLRAYLKVFPIQTISSDFGRQREICLDVFRQIFKEIDIDSKDTIEQCILAINNKYMTSFDETTFMIAYRFLEANGEHFKLPAAEVVGAQSDLERLMSKYDSEQRGSLSQKERGLAR